SNNRGNLIEILKWCAKTDPLAKAVLEESAANATYISHHIQNELLSIMANQIRDNIAEKLNGNVYVLLADEATDVSHNKQLSICLRAVDDQYKIKEYFMGFVRLCRFDAATLAKEINTTSTLKKWANTRWDSRFTSIDSIKSNYSAVVEALQDLVHDGGNRAVDARGLLVVLKDSMFIIAMFILHRLFGPIKILSDQLKGIFFFPRKRLDYTLIFNTKGICTDLGSAHNLIITICEQLNLIRDEDSFKELFQQAIIFGNKNGIDMNESVRMRRQKTIPARFKHCVVTTTVGHRNYNNTEENFRVTMYFPTIDSILVELNERFSRHNLQIANSITSLSPINEKFLDIETLQPLIDHLSLEKNIIKNEIAVIKPMIKDTKLSTVFDVLNELKTMKQAFPSTVDLIKGAITFPVSSVTCERSFSRMKLIKTYARNTMGDERLSDLGVLAIEKEFKIDFEKVVDAFAKAHKNSRIMLI
ncbi:unnamed protein product, partial [Didymodactylos carnosus]